MAKIKVVPMTNIEYGGEKRAAGCEPFDMDESTADELIKQRIVKRADESSKTTKSKPTPTQE